MHTHQARHILPMPVMGDNRLLCRFADLDKGTEGEPEIHRYFCADGSHHFVSARQTHEILTDRGKKLEVHFRPFALRYVARNREQTHGPAIRV